MIKCPNKNLRDYQELERLRGPQEARMLWMLHDGIVPESEYVKTYYGIMNLPGNEYLYEKYNLLNKKGEIKTVPYNTPAQMERTNEWVRRLNLSPFYAFKLGKAASGMKIFIYEKEPSAIDETELPMYKLAEEEAEKDFYYQTTVERVNEIKMVDSIMNKLNGFDTYIRTSAESNALLTEILTNQYGLTADEVDFIFSLEEQAERKGNNISFLISRRYSNYTSDEIAINRINKLKALQFDVELEKRLVDFASSLGITHEVVDDLKGRFEVDALGVADIVNRVIYLSKDRKLDTFPEEVAHFYAEFLGYKEGIGKQLFDKITSWSGYQAVYEEYKDIYKRRDGAIDEVKIKKEAIAKTIAEAIVKNYVIESENFSAEEKDFWSSLISFLKSIFERFRNSSYVPLDGITNDIATKILNNDIGDITKRVQAVAEKNRQLKTFDGTLENYPFARRVIEEVNKLGGLLTGSLAIRKQGTLYRNEDETVHDLDFSIDWRFYEGDYEKFVENFKEIFPNYRQISRTIFSGNSGEYVLNGMITDDDSLYERFTNLSGDFNSRLENFTLEEQGKMLLIDFFFYPEGRVTPSFEGTELAENVFAAKAFMGMRNKDAFDLLSYVPYERPTGLSEYSYLQTAEGTEGELPSFKTDEFYNIRPENSLNFIEQQQFKSSIDVGDVVTFSYWSETTSKIESVKDVLITEIEDDRFHGNYENEEGRTFKFINILNTTPPAKYSLADKNNFKKNLKLRKTVKIFVDNQPIAGAVKEIKEDSMVLDTNQGEVEINFDDIDKENYERNVIRAVTEVKGKLETHLRIIGQKVETEEQIQRVSAIRKALSQLENFKQLEDLVLFLQSIEKSVDFSKALMGKLINEDIPITKKLAMISFIKKYIDSFAILDRLNIEIQKLEGFDEMKKVSRNLRAMISETSTEYYDKVTPVIGKWLYSVFPDSINKDLIMLNEKPITEETIIEQLRDPMGDLDFLNTYLVPLSNANDATGGLFSKIMAKAFEGARMLTYKTERELMPLFDKVKAKFDNMDEVYKKMYRLKEITVTEKGKKVKKIVREFIQSENVQPYYDKIDEFNKRANAIQDEIDAIQATIDRGNLSYDEKADLIDQKKRKINDKKLVYQDRNEYREIYGKVQTAEEVTEMMNKLRDPENSRFNLEEFNNYLDYYYRITDNPSENYITVVDEESGETFYYEYKGNKWVANKDAINPNTGEKEFSTKEYEDLVNGDPDVFALYKAMKKLYDELQYKVPENRRLNGIVPAMWESAPLKSVWKSLKTAFISKDLQYLTDSQNGKQYLVQVDGTPYKQIPIGLSRPLDVSESSDNILSSLLMYASEVNLYRAKNDILGAVNILTDVVDRNKPNDETQKTKQKLESNRRADAIRKFINQVFYGEKRSGNAWWDKALDYLGLATAASRMVLKPSTALANIIIGNYSNLSEALGRRNFTPEDLRVAYAQYFDMLFTDRKKLDNMMLSLDAIQGMYNKEIGDYFRARREKMGFDSLFTLQDLGEREIQGVAMLALLNSWKVPIPEDGVFDTETLPDNFLDTLRELNKSNNGVYNDFDRLYMQDNSLFRLFLQFRKYVIPTFRSRYSGMTQGWRDGNSRDKYRIDYQAGKVEMGYYRAFAGFMWDTVTSAKNLSTVMERFDSLNAIEKEGVIRSIQDIAAVFAVTLILLPLAGADDDEATKEALESGEFLNWVHWEYIYQLGRLRGDISAWMMFIGFKDQMRMVNKPFAGASFLEQVYKLASMVVDFEEDDEGNISIWKQYDRNYGRFSKGDLKVYGPLLKIEPLFNVYEDFDPEVQFNDFNAASRG